MTQSDNTTRIWDLETGREVLTLIGYKSPVTGVSFSPDGSRLLTMSGGTVLIWDSRPWTQARRTKEDSVAFVASPSGPVRSYCRLSIGDCQTERASVLCLTMARKGRNRLQ